MSLRTGGKIMAEDAGASVEVLAESGQILRTTFPRSGSAGDRFVEWQYPLHSGKAFGLVGRIFICLTGFATAVLSITGVLIWWKVESAPEGADRWHPSILQTLSFRKFRPCKIKRNHAQRGSLKWIAIIIFFATGYCPRNC